MGEWRWARGEGFTYQRFENSFKDFIKILMYFKSNIEMGEFDINFTPISLIKIVGVK